MAWSKTQAQRSPWLGPRHKLIWRMHAQTFPARQDACTKGVDLLAKKAQMVHDRLLCRGCKSDSCDDSICLPWTSVYLEPPTTCYLPPSTLDFGPRTTCYLPLSTLGLPPSAIYLGPPSTCSLLPSTLDLHLPATFCHLPWTSIYLGPPALK